MKGGWMEEVSLGLHEQTCARAMQFGLSPEDAEDCASGFRTHLLGMGEEAIEEVKRKGNFAAWRDACMRNYIVNYVRDMACWRYAAMPAAEMLEAGGGRAVVSVTEELSPEASVQQAEFWDRFVAAAERISRKARHVLIRHLVYGESLRDLAATLGRKPHAVGESYRSALKQVRSILIREGMTDEEAGEYLALFERARDRFAASRPKKVGGSEK